jgi:hypothetical protein
MNRDKKLLMAFQKFQMANIERHFHYNDENVANDFLSSPEYKELEVTEEMIEEASKEYGEKIIYLTCPISFTNGAYFVKQHGTK